MFFENFFANFAMWLLIGAGIIICGWFLLHLISMIIVFGLALTVSMDKEYNKSNKFWRGILNLGYKILLNLSRTKIHSKGLDKVPQNERFFIISNHRSNFDNMVMSYVLRRQPLAFISKKENFKIPFGRHLINRNCYLSLDRGNIKSAMTVMNRSSDLIKSGETSIGVFPEGTRSKDGLIHDFMPGCFKVAKKSKCPIVVCKIEGTEKIHKNFPMKRTHVKLEFIDVLSADFLDSKNTVEISTFCKDLIEKSIEG